MQADAAKAKRATKSSSIRFISVDFDDSDRVREREIAKCFLSRHPTFSDLALF